MSTPLGEACRRKGGRLCSVDNKCYLDAPVFTIMFDEANQFCSAIEGQLAGPFASGDINIFQDCT